MKLALITLMLPLGGTTTFILFLCSGLRKLGIPVEVFSLTSDHPLREEFAALDVPVHLADKRSHIVEDRLASVYEKLREFQATAVFAVMGADCFELLRCLPAGVFRVGMVHDHTDRVYQLVDDYRPWMDHIAVVSQTIADHVSRRISDVPCTYLQHGVMFYDERVKRAPNPDRPLELIFFGRLQESQKQVHLFPEIYAALKRRGFPFRWTIHGEGPEKEFLVTHLRDAIACGEVRFSEPVRHDALPALIARHDVYLLTSAHEGGPLSLIEGMGRGLVPVCGEIPCLVQEMITPENGFRVPREQPEKYADAIEQLHGDRTRLERMSMAARAVALSGYNDLAMARRYVTFVEQNAPTIKVHWPRKVSIQPHIGANPFLFHPALRLFRRIHKTLQQPTP